MNSALLLRKGCIFKLVGLHLDLDLALKIFLTVVGLGLSYKNIKTGLDLYRKI